ncbi:hypothetical protein HPA31_03830 [Streptococcus suis]|nr:hypothetical protein [Streptococcus suis]
MLNFVGYGRLDMLNWNSDGKYFDVIEPLEMDSSILNSPKFEGDSLRKVVLRKFPKDNYFVKALQKVVHNTRPKIDGKDRGHLIADSFQDYLLTKCEIEEHQREVHQFFGKGNNVNIRSQSPESNRNSTELAGQLRFEQLVIDFLKKSENGEVYFEIEETTLSGKLGRRIFIKFLDSIRDDIHVFIPEER